MKQELEGWAVPVRLPLLAALGIVMFLVGALSIGGWLYSKRFAPGTRPPAIDFPAPQLEIVRSIPGEPHRTVAPPPPPRIAQAMAATAREGDALWGANQ